MAKHIWRVDGAEKVSGAAKYAGDIRLPGLLVGCTLRSPIAHGRIKSIDTSAARRIPGVRAVVTGADMPPALLGKRLRDMPILARERVRFIGEKVAAVAADSRDIAEEAIAAITVDYENLPAVFDPEAAMGEGAPVLHPDLKNYPKDPNWIKSEWRGAERQDFRFAPSPNANSEVIVEKGDADAGFRTAARIFEDRFVIPMQHHGFIEPHACTVAIDPDGKVRVWSCTKYPYELQKDFAAATGVPVQDVIVMPVRVGADFGGKGFVVDEVIAYFLARATGRPVQMVMSQNEEFIAGNHRHPAIVHLKSSVDAQGRLTAREVEIIFNGGAYAGYRPRMTLGGVPRAAGCYRIPNVRIAATCVYTNQVPCGHMRAPGQPQVIYAAESHTDRIARGLGMDPVKFRQMNVLRDGDTAPLGGVYETVGALGVIERATQEIGWSKAKKAGVGRGISLAERGTGTGRATVIVEIDASGRVIVRIGVMEVGTGSHTVVREVVARVLELPTDRVQVVQGDTSTGPFDVGSGGSKVTNTTGGAAFKATNQIRARLCKLAAQAQVWPEDQVRFEKGQFFCPGTPGRKPFDALIKKLVELNGGVIREEAENRAGRGKSSGYACHAVEVAVDRDTGQVRINRVVAAHDVGFVVNHSGLTGQIEGGFSQGFGVGLMEDLALDQGRLQVVNYGDSLLSQR
jgi:carbon-monoxide dehydrogenase large subunit